MRNKALLAVVVVVVIVAATIALWPRSRSTPASRSTTTRGTPTSTVVAVTKMPGSERPLPAWFARKNVKARRIAGRVTLDGNPAPGAMVTLQSALTHAGVGAPVVVTAGADGRFDFGEWPGATYQIIASAPDTQLAIKWIDLADPTLATDAIELRMKTCNARVRGIVSEASGAPIEDALVRQNDFIAARTNKAGEYSLCVPYGDVQLDYSADGYGAVVLGMAILGSTSQDVVLVPAATVSGHVIRADDNSPVADARITIVPRDWGRDRPATRIAISDTSGAFRIGGLMPGPYRVFASTDGLATESSAHVTAEVGVTNDVIIKLVARARITGVVMHGDKPLPGVEVTAIRRSPVARAELPGKTQLDGSFAIDLVPIGDLVFSIAGYRVAAPAAFTVDKPATYDNVTIQVAQMATIKGVVTRDGVPLPGADVCCIQGREAQSASETTDEKGEYQITGVPPGTYQLGAGSEEAGAFTIGRKVTVAEGETTRADFELELAGEIAGTVVDADGQPVPGVFVRWTEDKTQDQGRGPTDAQGRYRCGAMAGGGTYRAKVFASAESQTPFPPAPGQSYPAREVKDGKTKIQGVTIAIDRQQLTVSGRVVDSTGAAVVDATVRAVATPVGSEPRFNPWQKLPSTVTDPEGAFTLRGLVPGTYALEARATDGSESTVAGIAAGATGVTLTLVRAGSIEGTLVGYKQPPVIYATPWNAPNKLNPGAVDGTSFRVTGVRPGRYVVNAQNMYEGDAKAVDVRAGEKTPVTLTAKGRGTIEGTVIDFKTKKPLAGAVCRSVMSVDGQQGLTNWDVTTAPKSDASGHILVDPAPAGNVTITCAMPQWRYSAPAADVVVPAGGKVTVTLLSAELTAENPASAGIDFHWQVTPPRIADVRPNSSAAKAGVAAGDLVTAIDGVSIEGLNGAGVQHLIDSHPIGSTVSVTYQRGAAKKTVQLEMQQRGY